MEGYRGILLWRINNKRNWCGTSKVAGHDLKRTSCKFLTSTISWFVANILRGLSRRLQNPLFWGHTMWSPVFWIDKLASRIPTSCLRWWGRWAHSYKRIKWSPSKWFYQQWNKIEAGGCPKICLMQPQEKTIQELACPSDGRKKWRGCVRRNDETLFCKIVRSWMISKLSRFELFVGSSLVDRAPSRIVHYFVHSNKTVYCEAHPHTADILRKNSKTRIYILTTIKFLTTNTFWHFLFPVPLVFCMPKILLST